MQAAHFERFGGGPFDPYPLFNPLMIRRTCAGNRTAIGAENRAISARRLQLVIDRIVRFGEANEGYSYLAYHRHVGKVVISGD